MEAAYEFAQSGELMDFALNCILEGHLTPPALFIDLMVEKCQLINHHFCNTREHLRIVTSVTNTVATIQFHDILLADSKLKTVNINQYIESKKSISTIVD